MSQNFKVLSLLFIYHIKRIPTEAYSAKISDEGEGFTY